MFGGAGTLNFGAGPGERLQVVDLFGNSLGDGFVSGTVFNLTNTLTPARSIERGDGTSSQNYYWNEEYSNLAENTLVDIERDVDKVVADSGVSGTDGIANLTLLEASYVGLGQTTPSPEYAAWNFGILEYEKQLISGSFSRTTQSLGVGGTSFNVTFGGIQNQLNDANIIEPTKTTVDTYTTIDNLDQLYDRAKSWKVDSAANLQYPSLSELLIDGNGTELDLGNRNLVIDATAASAFSVNQGANTITIKAGTFTTGNKFSSIRTTGAISLQNGATLETGYTDSTGSYIYMELTNLDQQDILVTDEQNPSSPVTILNLTNQSYTYKTHFQLPAGGEINVLVTRDSYSPWTETIREVNATLSSITGANQILTIDLLVKLLQKTEAIQNSVNVQALPVPTINVTSAITSPTGSPSIDNQNEQLGLLTRILAKITALRAAIQN